MPSAFLCPITHEMMRNPVNTPYGQTYERTAIEEWIRTNHNCPFTRQSLRVQDLSPNLALKSIIEEYQLNHNHDNRIPIRTTSLDATGIEEPPLQIKIHRVPRENKTWVKVQSPDIHKEFKEKVLVLCLDISWSMSGRAMKTKVATTTDNDREAFEMTLLEVLIHGAKTLVQSCTEKHYIGIVVFSDVARIVVPIVRANDMGKKTMMDCLENLVPEGSTNLYDGIRTSMECIRQFQHTLAGEITSSIALFTDGEPSPQYSPSRGYVYQLKRYMASLSDNNKRYPAPVHIFTCGNNVDSYLADEISKETGGAYAFISDATMIGDILEHFISGFQCTRMQQIMLSIVGGGDPLLVRNIQYGQDRDFIIPGLVDNCKVIDIDNKDIPIVFSSDTIDDEYCFHVVRYLAIETMSRCMEHPDSVEQSIFTDEYWWRQTRPTNATIVSRIETIIHDFKNEIRMALKKENYNNWGFHYLLSIKRAYELQHANNYKDASVQFYGGPLFHSLLDRANDIFMTLPMLRKKRLDNYQIQRSFLSSQTYNSRIATGCVHGESTIHLVHREIPVHALRKGDVVLLADGNQATVECIVVCKKDAGVSLIRIGEKLWITEYHPIRYFQTTEKWCFPKDAADADHIHYNEPVDLYSIVLQERTTTKSGFLMSSNIEVASLGHGLRDPVVSHPFWGTEEVIRQLKTIASYDTGIVHIGGYKHCEDGEIRVV